jgi:hypothetical protein
MNADTTGLMGRLAYERRARPIRRSRPTEPRSFVIDFADRLDDAVAGLVGIGCGVVSGVINLESSGVEAPDWRPRHDEHYHEA